MKRERELARGGILRGEGYAPTWLKGPIGCVIPLDSRGIEILGRALALALEKKEKPNAD